MAAMDFTLTVSEESLKSALAKYEAAIDGTKVDFATFADITDAEVVTFCAALRRLKPDLPPTVTHLLFGYASFACTRVTAAGVLHAAACFPNLQELLLNGCTAVTDLGWDATADVNPDDKRRRTKEPAATPAAEQPPATVAVISENAPDAPPLPAARRPLDLYQPLIKQRPNLPAPPESDLPSVLPALVDFLPAGPLVFPSITVLCAGQTRIGDATLALLPGCMPNIASLDVSLTPVSGEGMKNVGRLKKLRTLKAWQGRFLPLVGGNWLADLPEDVRVMPLAGDANVAHIPYPLKKVSG